MRVIGTSGHVDHGKSSLIAALTGTHPDRLKEEKEREMTIDLGFGWLSLPNGQEVGIVDVPGHRDFIENMLAGIGGIDAVLLVIAADEGVMPQTREHLAILDLLQIQTGMVVITKIDLIDDPEWLELVESEIRSLLSNTNLCEAPIVRVSSKTRKGLPDLINCLALLLEKAPLRVDTGRPRLPIDRVFTMPGFGSIVTGTLQDGPLHVGEEIELLPSGLRGRIRGLQTHKQKEDVAKPGSRTAVNISGLDAKEIHRGEVLVYPGQITTTKRMDVRIRLLPDLDLPLKHHAEVKLFIGTAVTIADVRVLGAEAIYPGETGWVQLELRDPILAVRGDHIIIRRPSPGETLGGGKVIDPKPASRHKQFDPGIVEKLETLARGTPDEVIIQASHALGFAEVKDVLTRSGLDPVSAQAAFQGLIGSGQLVKLDGWVISHTQLAKVEQDLLQVVENYHKANPLRLGIPREELKSKLKIHPRLFSFVVDSLGRHGQLVEAGNSALPTRTLIAPWVAKATHSVTYSSAQKAMIDKLLVRFAQAPFAPPSIKECQAEVGEDVFTALLESAILIAVSTDVAFLSKDYEKMVDLVYKAMKEKGEITLAEARDLIQTSRKYIQALLEYMDSAGITVRVGDIRRLKNP